MALFLISFQFKIFTSLNCEHSLRSAVGLITFKPQHHLCSFRLFPKNWLSLPTTTTLLLVITPLALGIERIFAFLGLRHFVGLVLATVLAENPESFRTRSPCFQECYQHEKPPVGFNLYLVMLFWWPLSHLVLCLRLYLLSLTTPFHIHTDICSMIILLNIYPVIRKTLLCRKLIKEKVPQIAPAYTHQIVMGHNPYMSKS